MSHKKCESICRNTSQSSVTTPSLSTTLPPHTLAKDLINTRFNRRATPPIRNASPSAEALVTRVRLLQTYRQCKASARAREREEERGRAREREERSLGCLYKASATSLRCLNASSTSCQLLLAFPTLSVCLCATFLFYSVCLCHTHTHIFSVCHTHTWKEIELLHAVRNFDQRCCLIRNVPMPNAASTLAHTR
jgi:hypothetical protein